MEFTEILAYPTERDDWTKTLLIGGILLFFSFLLLPILLVYGYVVRTIGRSLVGDLEPPAFEAWGELLIDGVQAWVISLIYLFVPLLIASVTIGGSIVAIMTGTEAGVAAGFGTIMIGLVLASLLSIVFGYVAVAGIVNFAREGRFGAAFDFTLINAVIFDREYAVAWLVSVVILLVASVVTVIPFLGWLLAPFAGFYAMVVCANLWAGGFAQSLDSTAVSDRASGEDPAV